MTGLQIKAALVSWLLLTLAAIAQENQPSGVPVNPPPTPATRQVVVPPPPTVRPGVRTTIAPTLTVPPGIITPIPTTIPPGIVTTIPSPPSAGTFAYVEQSSKRQSAQARVVLTDGTKFAGELFTEGPLQVVALFGGIAIPLNQIRGIDWQTISNQEEQKRTAKVVFVNDDSLTVTIPVPAIQLKTDWGHATVDLAKIQSIVFGSENYTWEDTPLGRQLVPDDKP
jgi:hypothetical protein